MIKEKELKLKKLEVKDVKLKDYYRMEDIVKLDEDEIPLIGLTLVKMFKAIFIPNKKLFKRFILSQLPLELEEDEVKLQILNSELPVSNIKEYKKVVDVIVSLNDNIYVNLEVNRQHFYKIKNRNYLYKNAMINQTLKSGDNLKKLDNLYFYQINLNVKDKKDEYSNKLTKGTRTICTIELETKAIYLNNDFTYLKYLEYYRDLYYNKGVKLTESEMWLVMLTSTNYKELYETLGYILSNEERNEFIRKVIRLSNDKVFMADWDEELWDEYFEYLDEQEKIKKEEDDKRRKQEQEKLEQEQVKFEQEQVKFEKEKEKFEKEKILKDRENSLIINMINNNLDNETISKITNLSIEEIIKIKNSL